MTRNVAHLYLDSASIKALRELLGQRWDGITGDLAPEAPGLTLYSWAEVIAAIGGRAWTFSSRMTGSDFEGFEEEYPSLHVFAGSSRMEAASSAGRVFSHHRGESVEAIFIVRETITRSVYGEQNWKLGTRLSSSTSLMTSIPSSSRTAPMNGVGTTSSARTTRFAASGSLLGTSPRPPPSREETRGVRSAHEHSNAHSPPRCIVLSLRDASRFNAAVLRSSKGGDELTEADPWSHG